MDRLRPFVTGKDAVKTLKLHEGGLKAEDEGSSRVRGRRNFHTLEEHMKENGDAGKGIVYLKVW